MNDPGALIVGLLILAFFVAVYFFPYMQARSVDHPDKNSIFVVNLFLGWLLIPWVIALAWAFKGNHRKREPEVVSSVLDALSTQYTQPTPPRVVGKPEEIYGHVTAAAAPSPIPAHKCCPFCAEEIKVEAIRCKHCQADLGAAPG